MITGTLKTWRTGCWMIFDGRTNHYLDENSVVEVEIKNKFRKISWHPGPGGLLPTYHDDKYDEDRGVPEPLPARLLLDNVVPIKR